MSKVLYFVGCMARFRAGAVKTSTITILERLGIDFTILDTDEQCCGSVLLRTGLVDDFKSLAQKTAKLINSGDWDTVITSCAGCYRMFSAE